MTLYQEDTVTAGALRRNERIFYCAAFLVLLIFLGRSSFWGSEAYYGEIVREMAVSGNWRQLSFNGDPLPLFPALHTYISLPFVYWFGASEWSCRLPGVICGWSLIWAALVFGRRFFDRRTALAGAWMTLGSYGVLFWSRTVAPDIVYAAATVWAAVIFTTPIIDRAVWRYLLFILLTAVAFAAGGFVPLFLIFGLCLPFVSAKDRRISFAEIIVIVIIAVLLAVFCQILPSQLEILQHKSIMSRFYFMGSGNVLFGIGNVLRAIFPWSFFTVFALAGVLVNCRKLPAEISRLLTGIAAAVIFLAVSGNTDWGVFTGVVPFILVFTAGAMMHDFGNDFWNFAGETVLRWIVMLTASFALAFVVFIPVWNIFFHISLPLLITLSVPLAGVAALAILLFDSYAAEYFDLPARFGSVILAGTVLMAACAGLFYPGLDSFRTGKKFWLECSTPLRGIAPENIVSTGGSVSPQMLFYTGAAGRIAVAENKTQLQKFLDSCRGSKAAVVASTADAEMISEIGREYGVNTDENRKSEMDSELKSGSRKRSVVYFINLPEKTSPMGE